MAGSSLKKYKIGTLAKESQTDKPTSPVLTDKEPAAGKKDAKARKKRAILIVAAAMLAICVLYFAVPWFVSLFTAEETQTEKTYYFYPIVLDENIYADKTYTALDRGYYYEDKSYGTTVSFDPDTLSEVPSEYRLPVTCLISYIRAAIAGDSDAIAELYSDKFYSDGFTPKTGFTAQKIYETKFTINSTDTVEEDGESWERWSFWVEYKIYKNNGTFRNDMESDCTRKELFVITYRDGKTEIDGVTPYRES